MRRAFTILEITLALTMGMIVLTAALSLMASLDRTDARLDVRHEQRLELTRARSTIQRAMTSLVMDDSPQNDDAPIKPPPRLVLAQSPSAGAVRLFNRARSLGVDLGEPQRFEVVVKHSPTPTHSILSVVMAMDDDIEHTSLDLGDGEGLTHRGAFELWPDDTRPGTRHAEQAWADTSGMTLWWIPVLDDTFELEPGAEIPGAIPLASGLISCRWQVLRHQQRQGEYSATHVIDLPGFVEFEARTNAGIHVNWMFEIMWTEGPEISADDLEDDEDLLDSEPGGAGGGSGGGSDAVGDDNVRTLGSPSSGARSGRRSGGSSQSSGSDQ